MTHDEIQFLKIINDPILKSNLLEHPEILEFANDLVLRLLHKSDLENSAF